MSEAVERIDCFVLTGFLGSGKTTLLAAILKDPAFADTAVIVNEFGEISIDHDLLSISSDASVVMPGGCVCCSIREDIEQALRHLFEARDAGRLPPFKRIVIETTGIAEPVPLLMTLHQNPLALSRLNQPKVLTVLDGVLGAETLSRHNEAQEQVVHANRVVVSKTDLASSDTVDALKDRVATLNPWAEIRSADLTSENLTNLFAPHPNPPADRLEYLSTKPEHAHSHSHHAGLQTFSLTLEIPLDWTGFGVFMTLLLHRHGENVLRVKGLLSVDGLPGPTVFQSAQHLVHPPRHLEKWQGVERISRLVFIARGLDPNRIETSLRAFDHAARTAPRRLEQYLPAGGGGSIAGRPIKRPTAPRWIKA